MSARREPVAVVGAVDVYAPTGTNPYYRLKWTEPDGTPGDTSAGRVLELAVAKAAQIDQRVALAAGPKAVTALDDVLAAFVASGNSPYENKKAYKSSNASQLGKKLRRCLRGYEGQRAMDVTRELCDRMRAQAGTDSMVKSNTSALRALLHWGLPPHSGPDEVTHALRRCTRTRAGHHTSRSGGLAGETSGGVPPDVIAMYPAAATIAVVRAHLGHDALCSEGSGRRPLPPGPGRPGLSSSGGVPNAVPTTHRCSHRAIASR